MFGVSRKNIYLFIYLFTLFEIIIASGFLLTRYSAWGGSSGNLGYAYGTIKDLKMFISPINVWMAVTFSLVNIFVVIGSYRKAFLTLFISASAALVLIMVLAPLVDPYLFFFIAYPFYLFLLGVLSMVVGFVITPVILLRSVFLRSIVFATLLLFFIIQTFMFIVPGTRERCKEVWGTERKKACYFNLVEHDKDSWRSCLDLQGNDIGQCFYFYLYFGMDRKYQEVDEDLCSQITQSSTQSYCYSVLSSRARRAKTEDVCLQVRNTDFRDRCLLEFIRELSGPIRAEKVSTVCNLIVGASKKEECNKLVKKY